MSEINFVRPMTLREILRGSLALYRRHFWTFLAITLVYILLYYPLSSLIHYTVPEGGADLANLVIAPILNFAYAATVVAASNATLGRPVRMLDAYRRVLTPRILVIMLVFSLPFLLTALLYEQIYNASTPSGSPMSLAAQALDFLLLPIVSVTMHAILLFRSPVTVLEKRGLGDTIRRVVGLTFQNVNGKMLFVGFVWKLLYFWAILVLPFVLLTVPVLLYVLFTGLQPADTVLWYGLQVPAALFELFVSPYGLLMSILLYYDIRARKEAYNELVLAEEMGYHPIAEMIPV